MPRGKKRKADELTTEEAADKLFGKRVVKAVKQEVSDTDDSSTKDDSKE